MAKSNISKPILKWVGGKTQILDKIMIKFPYEINNYYEPFLGGGSVLLAFLTYVKTGKIKLNGNIYASDLNSPLIGVYKNIQVAHEKLYNNLQDLIDDLNSCDNGETNRKPKNITEAKLSKENYYYWIRGQYNSLSLEEKQSTRGSAMFIFLNKTCFRGLFRMGPNGFNVPYGNYKNPEIVNWDHLVEIHQLIQKVIFVSQDFLQSLEMPIQGDFVYLDPPYAPESSKSFVSYTEGGFSYDNHIKLFETLGKLNQKGVKFMMSNANVELVHQNFMEPVYKTTILSCKRAINSKRPNAIANEVVIVNY